MPERVVLHIDMDAFFAAIEQHRRPELRGKPVVIGGRGDPRERGVVSTASYEARVFGIRSAMPLRTAHARCPEAIFLPVDFPAYLEASRKVASILEGQGFPMQMAGLDEAYLELRGANADPERVARRIKGHIASELGVTASIGVGPNKLLAKLASDLDKPDGLTVLDRRSFRRRVGPLPTRVLPGIGPKTAAKLEVLGIHTVAELAAASAEELRSRFGPRLGGWLHALAQGKDDTQVGGRWMRKSLGHETTFQRDISDRAVISRALNRLLDKCVPRLRSGGYRTRTVTLKIRYAPFHTITRSRSLTEPTDEPLVLKATAHKILKEAPSDRPIRLLGLRLSSLEKAGSDPGDT